MKDYGNEHFVSYNQHLKFDVKNLSMLKKENHCPRYVKSHMSSILHINLSSRAQSVVKLVPGGRAASHFRGRPSADQAVSACCVVLFR